MKLIDKDVSSFGDKIIIIRLDLNVPISNGKIEDTNRIDKILDTLNYLLKKKSKLILVSHIGRPYGKKVDKLSLKPVAKYLEKKLKRKVKFIVDDIFSLEKKDLFKSNNEELAMLENIRYYENEEKNDDEFAKKLASLGDLYVNEAFSCSHRPHASLSKITKYIPSYAGKLLKKELNALNKITKEIIKPITCIIGGSKISSKIKIIENLIPKFDNIILVGGMANNIVKYKGFNIGKSIYEKNSENIINKIFELSDKYKCKIFIPEDFLIGKSLDGTPEYRKIGKVQNDDIILDIGKTSIQNIKNIILNSKTILWNGPAGYFENSAFSNGSNEIALTIARQTEERKLFSVLGGGDTVSLINKLNLFKKYNFVSTAGGAFLEFLEGKELPGIKALS